MTRRERTLLGFSLVALAGVLMVFASTVWLLWRTSIDAEAARVGALASALGMRTEQILIDAAETLDRLGRLDHAPCSTEHLAAMQDVAISRPYIRTLGHWRATERLCGVGFVQPTGLKPARADRIYDSGLIAWWPGEQTEVGGVRLLLLRKGDHDIAIDPTMLLDTGPLSERHAELWLDGLLLAATTPDFDMPAPSSVALGLMVDRAQRRIVSRYSQNSEFQIDIVAVEPLQQFWGRHLPAVLSVTVLGLVLISAWVIAVVRYSRAQASLAAQLRQALAAGRILVHYQPVMDMASGTCVGAEALARWRAEDGAWVGPDVFIPLAERVGLIGQVTLAVMTTVFRDLAPLLRDGSGFSVNLNLASEDLLNERFAAALASGLARHGIEPSSVKLEITERALITSEAARRIISELRQRGHQVVIDDFGTGYSSLSYLERLELDALKIDKSFVDGIGTGAVTGGVIGHIIEMAGSLGLGLVAEGIENAEQVDWLLARGVRFGQGFRYSKPLEAASFIAFRQAHSLQVLAPRPVRLVSGGATGGSV